MYQVRMPYRIESTYIRPMVVRRLKSSSSSGLETRLLHWIPTPCSSNSAKYSQPKPKATGDRRLCRGVGVVNLPGSCNQSGHKRKQDKGSYGKDFGPKANVVLPGHTEHIGQVEGEIDDPTTGCCQVGSGKGSTEQEALHDGHHCVGAQKEEDHPGVTVGQQVPLLYREERGRVVTLVN